MTEYRMCTRCVMDTTDPDITFDENGVCNHCHTYDRLVREHVLDGEGEAHLIALACSEPPEGYARWHLRLLADKAVELGYCEAISHTEVANILKKTN